jgi:hypothetical protein
MEKESANQEESYLPVLCNMLYVCFLFLIREWIVLCSLRDSYIYVQLDSRQIQLRSFSSKLQLLTNTTLYTQVQLHWIDCLVLSSYRLLAWEWSCSSCSKYVLWCPWCTYDSLRYKIVIHWQTSVKCIFARFLCSLSFNFLIFSAYSWYLVSPSIKVFWKSIRYS